VTSEKLPSLFSRAAEIEHQYREAVFAKNLCRFDKFLIGGLSFPPGKSMAHYYGPAISHVGFVYSADYFLAFAVESYFYFFH